MFLRLVELATIVAIIGFVVSQIAVPLWRNTPLFPQFRRGRERKLEAELKSAHQEIEDMKLQLRVEAAKKEAERLQSKSANGAL